MLPLSGKGLVCIGEMHSIYKVWCYLWFQLSTGGLGLYPERRGDASTPQPSAGTQANSLTLPRPTLLHLPRGGKQ